MSKMEFKSTTLSGLYVVQPQAYRDARGSLTRLFCKQEFKAAGLDKEIVQINQSVTVARGAVRGMHYQKPPFAEIKIIKCLRGKVFDVAVDLRAGSSTIFQWYGVELSAQQGNAIYIPEGFAHGFQVLEENSELLYMHTKPYSPEHEGAVRYDDPKIGIRWPLPIGDVSERDKKHPLLDEKYKGINFMNCRGCGTLLHHEFIDLGQAPPSNSFLTEQQLRQTEAKYPLKLFVCGKCFLVQLDEYKRSKEIFSDDYVYFSSYSRTWLEHAQRYVDMMMQRFDLNADSLVVELASNDGYLLQYFKTKGVPVLGIEPSLSVARAAIQKGIETVIDFFGFGLARDLSTKGRRADLITANNVLAHVPDLNDFIKGMKVLLKPGGVITVEFPHLMELIDNNQFDTIYQEHFSYFSLHTVKGIFEKNGLKVFDVETLKTHGGSLRVFAAHVEDKAKDVSARVRDLLSLEQNKGMLSMEYYQGFSRKAEKVRSDIMDFLSREKKAGKRIVAYGAAAKGNTLLNYCGISRDSIDFVVDASEHKQGKFLPGSHIPVVSEERIGQTRPNFILILPWNLKDEITQQLAYVRQWGARFVIPIPSLEVF